LVVVAALLGFVKDRSRDVCDPGWWFEAGRGECFVEVVVGAGGDLDFPAGCLDAQASERTSSAVAGGRVTSR